MNEPTTANEFVEQMLQERRKALESVLDADVISYFGPMRQPVDEAFRKALECIENKKPKLSVMLETSGGSIEVVKRCVDVIRHHYPDYVEFIVPNYAYSAGTVMCLSGNEIRMDYFSVLGPIDPQLKIGGQYVPAWGYVAHYERLIKKATDKKISSAEVTMLIDGFDYAQLHQIEQFRNLSVKLLKQWLPKYKFSNWVTTETKGDQVTSELKKRRAEKIAKCLSDVNLWNSHGHGISREVMEKEVNVKIVDFGATESHKKAIREYHDLAVDYTRKVGYGGYIHSANYAEPLWRSQ